MDNFDLNINNYSVSELEELLTLGKQYNPEDIRYKKDSICMKIVNDDTISFDMKSKLENFFEKASVLLRTVKNRRSGSSGPESNVSGSVENFTDLKMEMMKGTNNLVIQDPTVAHNMKIEDILKTPGKNVDSYGTDRGVINPLLVNTILKAVNIDTRFRDNYLLLRAPI